MVVSSAPASQSIMFRHYSNYNESYLSATETILCEALYNTQNDE